MVRILERYIAKTLLLSTAMTALILMSVLFIMNLLGELKDIGQGDYGLAQAVFYVFLRLPNVFYQFSPLLLLIGSIIGLSLLSSHRELAVMRTSGFSIRQIIWSVLCAAFLLVMAVSILGEGIGPRLSSKAEIRKENAQNAGQAVVTSAGVWFHVNNNFIHVEHVIDRQRLEGVTRYQFDDQHRMQAAYYAKTMLLQNDQWRMHDVLKTTLYNDRAKSQALPVVDLNLKINTNLLNAGLVEPGEMSLSRLLKFAQYLEQNGLQSSEYRFEFWQRVFMPVISLIMIFLAIPFVLGAFSAASLGWRLMVGAITGFTFFILNAFLGQLCVVYQVPALFAALLPLLGFAALGVFLSKKML